MRKYAFFDVDNTIYNGYTINDFNHFLTKKGIIPKSVIKKSKEFEKLYYSNKISYAESQILFIDLIAKAISGFKKDKIYKLGDEFIKNGQNFFPFVNKIFKFLNNKNFKIYLISASPTPIIEAIGRYFKIDNHFSTELEIRDNIYTGKVIRILSNEAKKQSIQGIVDPSLIKSLKLGFGDSTGDIEMLSYVDHAFVINPHQEEIKKIAKENKWNLVNSDNIISIVKKITK